MLQLRRATRASNARGQATFVDRAFPFLFWEGAFAMVYDTWMGPTYLSGLAGELGVSVLCVSLITSAAWIGAVGQFFGVWAFERTSSYRTFTLRLAVASRALWLLPLFMAAFWTYRRRTHGDAFPTETWFMLVAAVACLVALFGSTSGTGWNSWMRALVPESKRGRFFGTRQRYVMAALTCANLLAAVLVGWRLGGFHAGYAVLGVLGVSSAALSTFLLSRVRDAEPHEREPVSTFRHSLKEALKDRQYRGIVIFGAAFNGAMQLASSYFPYYFTKELHIPMSQIALWSVLANLGCMLAAGRWGHYLDRVRDVRPVMRILCVLLAVSPLLYLSSSVAWVRFIAPLDYFSNGMVWIGFQLGLTTLLFKSVHSERPAFCFAFYSVTCGLAGAVCSLLGGRLAVWLAPLGGFRALWLIASSCRLVVVWGCYRFLSFKETGKPVAAETPGELIADFA